MRHNVTRAALGVLLSVLAAVGLAAVASPAQAAVIRCSTRINQVGSGWKVSVNSNHRDVHRVHSFIAYYNDNRHFGSLTFKPYGESILIGGHRYYHFRSWQSGTECRPVDVPGDIAGAVQANRTGRFVLASYSTPTAPRATIRCWVVTPTPLSGGRWVLRVGSNHHNTAKVHSFRVQLNTGLPDNDRYWRTFIPTGPNYVTPRLNGRPDVVRGWQSGTPCAGYVRR